MRILEKEELSQINGGVTMLIKAPVVLTALTFSFMYLKEYFLPTIDIDVVSAPSAFPKAPDLLPTTQNGWDEFFTVGQQTEKKPSIRN
jgi:hypothetical protein